MKKSVFIFITATVLSIGMIAYGWIFVNSQIGEATLTEETLMGNRDAASGLVVSFRADSADNLHWFNRFDYDTDKTKSTFKRGEIGKTAEPLVYDDIRFNGWSKAPFYTKLTYGGLEGLQEKKIQGFYDEIQRRVMESGTEETGKIRVADYLDYYPVSFKFRFGTKNYNSENALNALKVFEENGTLSEEKGTAYDDDVALYAAFNRMFKIPVIKNEYQEYQVSKAENYDKEKSLGYKTEVEKPLGKEEDYYEFDPLIVLQEENIKDGKKWVHPDLSGGIAYDPDDDSDASYIGRLASEYNLKNRMLFMANNRTVKGAPIDVSAFGDGYGIYELPFIVVATTTITNNPKSRTVTNPEPAMEKMKMVYPLDERAEYVEMSMSGDHRFLAVFFVRDGSYFVDMVDADTWKSQGAFKLFSASENMTYTWGKDGSLAVTNHKDSIAVLAGTGDEHKPYELIYSGKVPSGFADAFFDSKTLSKEHFTARHKYGIDRGLAVTVKDGKAALVQNLLTGERKSGIRNAALECAVISHRGVLYRGRLKSDIVDFDYDMSAEEIRQIRENSDAEMMKNLILPVRNENRAEWKTAEGQ